MEAYSKQHFRLLSGDSGGFAVVSRAKADSKVVETVMDGDVEWWPQRCRNGTGSGVEREGKARHSLVEVYNNPNWIL